VFFFNPEIGNEQRNRRSDALVQRGSVLPMLSAIRDPERARSRTRRHWAVYAGIATRVVRYMCIFADFRALRLKIQSRLVTFDP
jgi:hypothetical protein